MPDCDYCAESFEDEQAYLRHLEAAHESELGTIDQRRVEEELDAGGGGLPTKPLAVELVVVGIAGLVIYVAFLFDPGGTATDVPGDGGDVEPAQEPAELRTAHEHGTIEMTIDGERIDFSQSQYQVQSDEFHFENGNGRIWHKHARGVTLEWAMATLGIGVTGDTVTYQGTTYNDSDPGTEVIVEVNGEPVDPRTYVLQGTEGENTGEGDHVRIVVRTDG